MTRDEVKRWKVDRREDTPVSQAADRRRRSRRRWLMLLTLLAILIFGILTCLGRYVFGGPWWPEAFARATIVSGFLVGPSLGVRLGRRLGTHLQQ